MAPSVISLVVTTKHIYIYIYIFIYHIIYIYYIYIYIYIIVLELTTTLALKFPFFIAFFFHVGIPCWSGRSSIEATEGEAPGNGGRHFRGQGRQGGVELKIAEMDRARSQVDHRKK